MKTEKIISYLDYTNKKIDNLARTIFCITLILIGGSINFVAILSNDGRMPVYTDQYINNKYHFSYNDPETIKLHKYSDIYKINNIFFSIGDIIMICGVILFNVVNIIQIRENKKIRKILNKK